MTPRLSPLALAALLLVPPSTSGAESVTRTVVVTARFESRTSLSVSTQLLQFQVVSPDQAATAIVDFSAAARTLAAGEVVLSVEPLRALDGPGGAADVGSALTFTGEGEGTLDGVVRGASPAVAGRWMGSGTRSGRLVFSLRAAASGSYAVPVRFALSAP